MKFGSLIQLAEMFVLLPLYFYFKLTFGDGVLSYNLSPNVLPAGLSFDQTTRTLSGTPRETTTGAVTLTWTVKDGYDNRQTSDAATLTFTLIINPSAPSITASVSTLIATVGTAIPAVTIITS